MDIKRNIDVVTATSFNPENNNGLTYIMYTRYVTLQNCFTSVMIHDNITGAPDLRDRFIVGAYPTGGSSTSIRN